MTAPNVALLIDAENVPASCAAAIVEKAESHGMLTWRRVYGDFSNPSMAGWLEAAPRNALTPCQTISGAAGKNGADIAFAIDAMDLLHAGKADVFCFATCDGDFTQLAMRMRQAGKIVVGVGMQRASLRFRSACNTFEIVHIHKTESKPIEAPPAEQTTVFGAAPAVRALKASLLQKVFTVAPPMDGEWVGLADVMKALKDCQPGFAVKAYGHSQLSKLLAFSGVELTDQNRKARLANPILKKVVDNG